MTAPGGRRPRVFTIPAGTPFLPTLADALLAGTLAGGGPAGAALADATVYLPTRRAGRALAALLAERSGSRALLLPRIVPLGEPDVGAAEATLAAASPDAPPPITPLERRLVLARLVQAWTSRPDGPRGVAGSPAEAVRLAADLEALMDALATEDVPWAALEGVVETEFSEHFAETLRFLRIAHESWPAILADRRASDPVRHRDEALRAEAERLGQGTRGPVVAAGSTGSVPATARLLAAISRLPDGAVVLPGLDLDLDAAAWDLIGGRPDAGGRPGGGGGDPIWGHPQFMLRRLLRDHLGIGRDEVRVLGPTAARDDPAEARRRLLSEAMRPAETTESWSAFPAADREEMARAGSAGLAVVEAADEREEALAIAVALRETLASPGRRAALVTPDRALARRVAAELGRWDVGIEDSAGLPLADSPAGRLARLAAEAAALDFHPVRVLALLSHPAVTLGLPRAEVERAAGALEIGALRGPAPRPGLAGLSAALALRRAEVGGRDPLPRRNLAGRDWDAAADLLRRLEAAFAGFGHLPERRAAASGRDRPLHGGEGGARTAAGDDPALAAGKDRLDMAALAARHADVVTALLEPAAGDGPSEPAGLEALLDLFEDLSLAGSPASAVLGRFEAYPDFFHELARERALAPEPRRTHRRLRILGLLEARLLDLDRVVLGGLDEGLWPPKPETDSLLNRPMRLALGLSPPERRLGQTAHDFVQALGCRDAVVTRAAKRDGKPTVPSRFLERLQAFAGPAVWAGLTGRGETLRGWAGALDRPRPVPPLPRPAPEPGGGRFPRRLGVTEVETLVRDPYAIFARHVLKLSPLDPLAVRPSLADRGSILHDVLAGFAAAHPEALPEDAAADLLQRALEAFRPIEEAYPELYALWEPDFERLVPRFLEWEAERRAAGPRLFLEPAGRLEIALGSGPPLVVAGRADRIEIGPGGAAAVVDYKSGALPSNRDVLAGLAPQLTLEAAMLARGGFEGVPRAPEVPELLYVKLGGRDRLRPQDVKPPGGGSLAALAESHVAGLTALARRYAAGEAGYLSRRFPRPARRALPYDHLARVAEWSIAGSDVEGDAPP